MKERKSYAGKLNGVFGFWCDQKPEGLEDVKVTTFYTPDEGKVFVDKDGELLDSVVIRGNVKISDYTEIKDPRPSEQPMSEPMPEQEKPVEE